MIRSPLLFALSLAALWPATVALAAPQQKPLGTFGDWAAVADGGDKRLCYIGSAPKKAEEVHDPWRCARPGDAPSRRQGQG